MSKCRHLKLRWPMVINPSIHSRPHIGWAERCAWNQAVGALPTRSGKRSAPSVTHRSHSTGWPRPPWVCCLALGGSGPSVRLVPSAALHRLPMKGCGVGAACRSGSAALAAARRVAPVLDQRRELPILEGVVFFRQKNYLALLIHMKFH